jgi:very-short-patch-repair endonuclease
MCFDKSFASHEKSQYWSEKNKLSPINLALNSHEKYLFNCNKCGHEINLSLLFINSGGWCSFCYGVKICLDDNCKSCFNKSFASNEKSKYWSPNNTLKPREVIKGSRKRIKFICEKNHEFETKLSYIDSLLSWCPKCCNKTEGLVLNELQKIYSNIKTQYKPIWCRNENSNRYLPFDFVLENEKIIIELDGCQHFKQVKNWDTPISIQERDKYKMKKANENKYSIIRITQEYVVKKNSKWLEELKANIDKVISESKVQNIYMCKKDEYKIYQE